MLYLIMKVKGLTVEKKIEVDSDEEAREQLRRWVEGETKAEEYMLAKDIARAAMVVEMTLRMTP